jgi:hypothetical protein
MIITLASPKQGLQSALGAGPNGEASSLPGIGYPPIAWGAARPASILAKDGRDD